MTFRLPIQGNEALKLTGAASDRFSPERSSNGVVAQNRKKNTFGDGAESYRSLRSMSSGDQ
ncbi:hypothetical protein CEE69_03035 [Rhodopirellula bahusiensis]|uniref:Uncharacterized protein n=1 Tax=Rhodopirellula bahusiensis TaxID=2014065 RepID=A0A2G1WBH1_9BACT|nr:hypothetical protein CEE69_03035 [Rhodopirellula bahusiensis]